MFNHDEYKTCIGGFAGPECFPLFLRFTTEHDMFHKVGDAKQTSVKPGELSYCRESSSLTRRFTWQQSLDSRLTNDSKEALFVAEVLDGMSDDFARQIQQRLTSGLQQLFDAEVESSILHKDNVSHTFHICHSHLVQYNGVKP